MKGLKLQLDSVHPGIRFLTLITAIRWFGWGIAETLIPVFLFSFGTTYAEAGALQSIYTFSFIIALTFVGSFADKKKSSLLILISLFLFMIVGSGYFLAGATGLVVFVVIARFLDGIAVAFDLIGKETYIMRHAAKEKIASTLGYFDSIVNFWWIIAAFCGLLLIKYYSIPQLLFFIVPTTLISLLLASRFIKTEIPLPAILESEPSKSFWKKLSLHNLLQLNGKLKLLAVFNFFLFFCISVAMFFLPVEVYTNGASYSMIIIMGIIAVLPYVFGFLLGKWFDSSGVKLFFYALLFFTLLLFSLVFYTSYLWVVFVSFSIGIISEIISVGNEALITEYSEPEHFGKTDGVMKSINNLGTMAGPFALGFVIDIYGIHLSFLFLAILMSIMCLVIYIVHRQHGAPKASAN